MACGGSCSCRCGTPARTAASFEAALGEAAADLEGGHGSEYQRARQQYLRTLAADTKQPSHVRGWATQEANRLARISAARTAGRRPPGGDPYRYKGVPGYDVGHRPGFHLVDKPSSFRLEWARDNRARPGYARRLGVQHKWREGELEMELEAAAEALEEVARPRRTFPRTGRRRLPTKVRPISAGRHNRAKGGGPLQKWPQKRCESAYYQMKRMQQAAAGACAAGMSCDQLAAGVQRVLAYQRARAQIQSNCWNPANPGWAGHIRAIADLNGTLTRCQRLYNACRS
jgi:hypothetical protein